MERRSASGLPRGDGPRSGGRSWRARPRAVEPGGRASASLDRAARSIGPTIVARRHRSAADGRTRPMSSVDTGLNRDYRTKAADGEPFAAVGLARPTGIPGDALRLAAGHHNHDGVRSPSRAAPQCLAAGRARRGHPRPSGSERSQRLGDGAVAAPGNTARTRRVRRRARHLHHRGRGVAGERPVGRVQHNAERRAGAHPHGVTVVNLGQLPVGRRRRPACRQAPRHATAGEQSEHNSRRRSSTIAPRRDHETHASSLTRRPRRASATRDRRLRCGGQGTPPRSRDTGPPDPRGRARGGVARRYRTARRR